MSNILEALPGYMLPIAEVNRQLGQMWQPGKEGSGAPSEFRASQMNLILHFGKKTTADDARARFEEAIHFSQRYPCRIIVLCPEIEQDDDSPMEAKLFAQCYIGHTPRTMCCCEALMLGYPSDDKGYLKNQVSIWLENDLPICHWFHRVPQERIREHYRTFSHGMKRILFDGTVEGPGFMDIPWEDPNRVKDLAFARLLPIRQSIGQYLSGFPPEQLIQGVSQISLSSTADLSGEARNLADWMQECLTSAGASDELEKKYAELDQQGKVIHGEWCDKDGKTLFSFKLDLEKSLGTLHAQFANCEEWPFEAHVLGAREALSEAVFF